MNPSLEMNVEIAHLPDGTVMVRAGIDSGTEPYTNGRIFADIDAAGDECDPIIEGTRQELHARAQGVAQRLLQEHIQTIAKPGSSIRFVMKIEMECGPVEQ